MKLHKITTGLRTSMNNFIGLKPNTPLTIQTIKEVQEKFWPGTPGIQAFLCTDLWNACDEAVNGTIKELSHTTQRSTSSQVTPVKSKRLKKPVICSTREGLDLTLELKQHDNELIVDSVCINPGGSSINIARALNSFGTPFKLIGINGIGVRSDIFTELLKREGIDISNFIDINNDIRFHFCTFIEGKEYWVPSPPPFLDHDELDRFTTQLFNACDNQKGEALAFANNPPLGASETYMADIIKETTDRFGMFTIYDTKLKVAKRELVDSVLKVGPSMIKPNIAEYAEIVGLDESKLRHDRDLIAHLAQELINKYDMKMILVSLDKDGAMLIDKKRAAVVNGLPIKVVSTVGAGDSGIAATIDRSKKEGYSLKKLNDEQFKKTLSAFLAAGSATATKPGTELGSLEEVQNMEKQVKVSFI